MAVAYECSECEHVQVVGQIDHSIGFADPHAVCDNCGAVGHFCFAPGTAERDRAWGRQPAEFNRRRNR